MKKGTVTISYGVSLDNMMKNCDCCTQQMNAYRTPSAGFWPGCKIFGDREKDKNGNPIASKYCQDAVKQNEF